MTRIALLDGDILVYSIAAAEEKSIDWGEGLWSIYADEETGRANLDLWIDELVQAVGADDYVITLSDPDANWRKGILPTYKANRANVRPPMIRRPLDAYLRAKPQAKWKPTLEADDVMGIMATNPRLYPGAEKVIVSIDKDLRTIPGLLWNWKHKDRGVVEVTPEGADLWHLQQALQGDATDGYDGCPGMGPVKAAKVLADRIKLVPYEHTFARGARKGETETRFNEEPAETLWEVVTSHYRAAGFGEAEALTQARVARILRHGEFNYTTGEVRLWTPA